MQKFDIIIIGAGAAGLMCMSIASKLNKKVLVIDKGKRPGRKILISGGGKCNFTNLDVKPEHFLCTNSHFLKSCLSQYSNTDFIDLVDRHNLDYYYKNNTQLFSTHGAKKIVDLLLNESNQDFSEILYNSEVTDIDDINQTVITDKGNFYAPSIILACGGFTMPRLLISDLGYRIAQKYKLKYIKTRPALVPMSLNKIDTQRFAQLSGISLEVKISLAKISFCEKMLFTHKGISGPSVLQISSFWRSGDYIYIDLLPKNNIFNIIENSNREKNLKTVLTNYLPRKFVENISFDIEFINIKLKQLNHSQLDFLNKYLHNWQLKPASTLGYDVAEVTYGGIHSSELCSKTFKIKKTNSLYAIGEVTEVTGFLGGYNFQYAWSSGYCAGIYA